MSAWTRDHVRLRETERGRWWCHVGGHHFDVVLDGTWVVYVDGVERFSAYRLTVAQDKIADWLCEWVPAR